MNTFILIVLGQIVSLFGNAALRFALPLYLLRQTGSAALYGGITALAMLPALAGMLTGGALGLALRVPTLQFGSILVLGAVFMAVAALFNVWFFAQLQVLVPQAQLGKTTACLSVLACLTQPIGQAAYGSAFQHWAAHPADVLLAAGVLSALVLWLLQTRRTV